MDEDSALNLTPLQLESLVDYILKESVFYLDSDNSASCTKSPRNGTMPM